MNASAEKSEIGMIVAFNSEGVIGLNGTVPWHYSADLKRFKRVTLNSTIIMGRNTWDSLPFKPLPERRNIVITSRPGVNAESFSSIKDALASTDGGPIWFIGGRRIYEEAVTHCGFIDVTYVPDLIPDQRAVKFPDIDWSCWMSGPKVPFEDDARLCHQRYTRRRTRPDGADK